MNNEEIDKIASEIYEKYLSKYDVLTQYDLSDTVRLFISVYANDDSDIRQETLEEIKKEYVDCIIIHRGFVKHIPKGIKLKFEKEDEESIDK